MTHRGVTPWLAAAIALLTVLFGGCGGKSTPSPRVLASPAGVTLRIERVQRADTPAAFAYSPRDGSLWYGELRNGRIFNNGRQRWDFAVSQGGESGLESLAISPEGAALFAYISIPKGDPQDSTRDSGEGMVTRVVRLSIDADGSRSNPTTILEVPSTGIHNAGSVAFGSDGYLYVDIGDNHDFGESQDLSSPFGKILRVTIDGAAAPENPFAARADADARVWAYGIRNTFAFDRSRDGRMLGADNGDTGDDEINEIRAGANYGWPPDPARAGDEKPLRTFTETIAPSGFTIVPAGYGAWSDGHHALVCGFVLGKMLLVDLADAASAPTPVVDGCTLRIARDPTGRIIFANKDGIWRLTP
jgi:glucose/arabinose dehydrogenase